MPSERVQRRINSLLDEAEQAMSSGAWDQVTTICDSVLRLDPDNADANEFLNAARRDTGVIADLPPVANTSDATIASSQAGTGSDQPTSFASGRYTVSKFLGEGGKKKVYLAHDNTLDRDVAFALIKTDGLDETSRERVKREAQAMGRMGTHPCVMPIYDLGEENGQPFMVQPLMGGGDVEGLVEDADGPLLLEDAIRIATQTAQGLVFAHSKGIIHRDLKPGNVWLDDDGAAKIGDFGLAVATDRSRLTVEKVMVGTVSYMPPEQATGGEVTPRADLYSLGAMLYEMCTGRVPFMADDDIGVISQHINTPPVAPSWHNSQIPKTLDSLILRLLSKDPAERPDNADEVLVTLKSVDLSAVEEPGERQASLDSMAGGVFVGRQREMDQLKSIFEEVLSGKGRMVTLVGEPGIGKTRTAQELATYAGMRGAEVLWGRSYESGGAPPYWPWVQAIRSHVASTDETVLRAQLGATAPVIAEVVSDVKAKLPDLSAPTPIEDPESARFRLFDSISTFLKNISSTTPLVLMLEDLHWSDKPSLMLLEFVARELANSRILIVGNYRDMELNRRHPLSVTLGDLSRERLFERVVLRGLQKHDVQRFIEIAAGITPPPALVDTVFKQTEGNPLFVTETVRLLIQEGDITSGQSSKGGITSWEIRIPEGVREVIGRRLDRLSERCNEVLTIAAVISRQFRFDILKMLAEETTDSQLLDAMDEALSARIIEELPEEVGLYQFTHASMQETLMTELSHTCAVRMHARIAEALETYWSESADRHAAEIAAHYIEAEVITEPKKVVRYSRVAGELALNAVAMDKAAYYFDHALDAAEVETTDEDVAAIRFGRGKALSALERRDEAAADLTFAFDRFVEAGRNQEAVNVARARLQGMARRMLEIRQRALTIVEPDSVDQGYLLAATGEIIAGDLGRYNDGMNELNRALEIAKQHDDPNLEFLTLNSINLANIFARSAAPTREYLDRALELSDRVDDLLAKSLMYHWLGIDSAAEGRHEEAFKYLDDGIEVSLKAGYPGRAVALGWTSEELAAEFGDWPHAKALYDRCQELYADDARPIVVRALVDFELGDDDSGFQFISRLEALRENSPKTAEAGLGFQHAAPQLCIELPQAIRITGSDRLREIAESCATEVLAAGMSNMVQLNAKRALADLLAERGEVERAEALFLEASTREGGNPHRDRGLAWTAMAVGRLDDAIGRFEADIAVCRKSQRRSVLAWSLTGAAESLVSRNLPGDREKAIELQDEAIAIATELGMKPLLERVLAKREILKA